MKKLKRLMPIYIIMVCCIISLAGCGGANYDGKNLVDRAKKMHTELEAAHITVSDKNTGEYLQEITYRFEGDVMQYMYIGRDAETGEEYYEFNNGTELDTWHTGDTAWTAAARGSEGYYNYSRAKRHYFADGELLLNDYAAAVTGAEAGADIGDRKKVALLYDDSVISQYGQMTGVSGYRQTFGFTETGRCDEVYVNYMKDDRQYGYCIRIDECDPAKPIARVEPPALAEKTENGQ